MNFKSILTSPLIRRTRAKLSVRSGRTGSAGACLKVYPDDVFITSYPRSGNTWVRFLVGDMVYQKDIDFHNMERYVPDIYRCTHAYLESLDRPRYLKSHEPYDRRYAKVVYLIRDPRDVAVSYYTWLIKFKKAAQTFDSFIVDFVHNRTRYGGWGNHVESWHRNAKRVPNGLLFIRYEDLLANTVEKLLEVASFLQLGITEGNIERIAERNRLVRMRQKEEMAQDVDLFRNTRADIKFIGKGTAGQWREHFSDEQIAMFADLLGALASRFDYDLSVV